MTMVNPKYRYSMKRGLLVLFFIFTSISFAQDIEKPNSKEIKKANNYIYDANNLVEKEDFISAEMDYRVAISENPKTVAGTYNLGHAYYKKGNFDEALFRHQEAAKNAVDKKEKHSAYHNIGNILMQNKLCKEAVEAYKNALRNDPTDEETRYNLALAQDCAKDQQGDGEDNKQDENQDQNKDDQDQKQDQDQNKDDNKDQGDKDQKEGDEQKDENGKPKEDKQDKGDGEDNKKQDNPKPQPGKLSPQQIKNILDAMNNQEQKVQEKINAEKQKGAKVKTEKDW